MARAPRSTKHDSDEGNLQGLPPADERQRPNSARPEKSAWVRGDGGMEGPAGWSSEFGRAGFASKGDKPADPAPPSPLEPPAKSPPLTDPPVPSGGDQPPSPEQGHSTDAWDRPYGDATWGGPAAQPTPEQDRQARAAAPKKPAKR